MLVGETMAFRLQTLLDLRVQGEKSAEEAVAQAVGLRSQAEDRQGGLDESAQAAAAQVITERTRLSGAAPSQLEDGIARGHYMERLRAVARAQKEDARVHRDGPLREAVLAESTARQIHKKARQDREALDKHKASEEAAARKIVERRAEDAASDLALSLRSRRKM